MLFSWSHAALRLSATNSRLSLPLPCKESLNPLRMIWTLVRLRALTIVVCSGVNEMNKEARRVEDFDTLLLARQVHKRNQIRFPAKCTVIRQYIIGNSVWHLRPISWRGTTPIQYSQPLPCT